MDLENLRNLVENSIKRLLAKREAVRGINGNINYHELTYSTSIFKDEILNELIINFNDENNMWLLEQYNEYRNRVNKKINSQSVRIDNVVFGDDMRDTSIIEWKIKKNNNSYLSNSKLDISRTALLMRRLGMEKSFFILINESKMSETNILKGVGIKTRECLIRGNNNSLFDIMNFLDKKKKELFNIHSQEILIIEIMWNENIENQNELNKKIVEKEIFKIIVFFQMIKEKEMILNLNYKDKINNLFEDLKKSMKKEDDFSNDITKEETRNIIDLKENLKKEYSDKILTNTLLSIFSKKNIKDISILELINNLNLSPDSLVILNSLTKIKKNQINETENDEIKKIIKEHINHLANLFNKNREDNKPKSSLNHINKRREIINAFLNAFLDLKDNKLETSVNLKDIYDDQTKKEEMSQKVSLLMCFFQEILLSDFLKGLLKNKINDLFTIKKEESDFLNIRSKNKKDFIDNFINEREHFLNTSFEIFIDQLIDVYKEFIIGSIRN